MSVLVPSDDEPGEVADGQKVAGDLAQKGEAVLAHGLVLVNHQNVVEEAAYREPDVVPSGSVGQGVGEHVRPRPSPHS